jgi:hypothetical protein
MRHRTIAALALAAATASQAQTVQIQVQADSGRIPISPWIYGRNNSMSDDTTSPVGDSLVSVYNEAGLRMTRETGGNNLTKYNWRKKLSSHPDWYNNVYPHDWDFDALSIQRKLPGVQGLFGFPLLGWVASNTSNNFNDWSYNQSQWWTGTAQNLAGGGKANAGGGSHAATEGNAALYTQPWPADSSAAILGSWFGPGGVGLDSTRFRYWGMDNEPEIWNGTHDDVDSLLTGRTLTAEDYVQRWAATAKAARLLFPGIKLVGPASPSEWQWYTWTNSGISYKGKSYCYPEYLVKRLAEIQDSTGVRMLDVYDVHLYYSASKKATVQQTHRILWDTTYSDPDANGLHEVNGGWDSNISRQYFFGRVQAWADQYFGKGNGISFGTTEVGIDTCVSNHPSEVATWYASQLGTMADHGGELYTSWYWYPGMWEVLHLFSRYGQPVRVRSTSSLDSLVSAYSSISGAGDSLTVVLVNRGSTARTASVALAGFVPSGSGTSLQLSGLSGETFKSHAQNAIQKGTMATNQGAFTASLPGYSVVACQFAGTGNRSSVGGRRSVAGPVRLVRTSDAVRLEDGPVSGLVQLRGLDGATVRRSRWDEGAAEVDLAGLHRGLYVATWEGGKASIAVP